MRAIRQSGSEGGGALGSPYPYSAQGAALGQASNVASPPCKGGSPVCRSPSNGPDRAESSRGTLSQGFALG